MIDPTTPTPQDTSKKPTGLVESQVEGQRRIQLMDPTNPTPQASPGTGPPDQVAVPPESASQINAATAIPQDPAPPVSAQGHPITGSTMQAAPSPSPLPQPSTPSSPMPQTTAGAASPAPPSTSSPGAPSQVTPAFAAGQARSSPPKKTRKGSYVTALVLTGSVIPVPVVATVITAGFYISPLPQLLLGLIPWIPPSWIVIFVGLVVTLFFWLVLTVPFKRMTTFDNANALSGNHIRSHFNALKASFKVLQQNHVSSGASNAKDNSNLTSPQNDYSRHYDIAFEKVRAYLATIDEQLDREELCWVTGSGYLNVWNLIHRAEETMIDIAPHVEVLREAFHDELSLEGSSIDARDSVLTKLRAAVKKLSPSATLYMDMPPEQSSNGSASARGGTASNGGNGGTLDAKTEVEARDAIHNVKQTLNEFRDGLWEGLVRIRNQLAGTTLYTGLLTYILLCIAIIAGAPIPSIKAALIFYLVGAMIGFFGRLYIESQADRAVGDYGLTLARIVVTPVLSGLAAIAGVLLVAMLSFTLLRTPAQSSPATTSSAAQVSTPTATSVPAATSTPTPSATATVTSVPTASPTAAPTASTPSQQPPNQNTPPPSLDAIYDLDRNSQGIVVAAIFGLTPNILISVLQQKAQDFQTQIKNSTATDQGKT